MTRKKPTPPAWLNPKGATAEAKRRAAEDAAQRRAAEKAASSIILGKGDVQGDYDASRVLMTTLGGVPRALTHDDLKAFRANMRTVQARLSGRGVTAKQVLELARAKPIRGASGTSDMERADAQIRMAVPISALATKTPAGRVLDVRFMTNAGPDSTASRHHVLVRFLGFDEQARAMQATPTSGKPPRAATTPKQAANTLRRGYLAFDCDCDRHRYFFRFITTIGGFNAGRDEHGYPKITNPTLRGVACKHVLRVMAEVNSSAPVLTFLERAMGKVLTSADNTARIQSTQADTQQIAAKQAARPRDIAAIAKATKKQLTEAAKKAKPLPKRTPGGSRRIVHELASNTQRGNELLAQLGVLTEADRAALKAALNLTGGNKR